jgi:DNA-directed RNA polymerase subunit M/transcription elongation factor TFIIS
MKMKKILNIGNFINNIMNRDKAILALSSVLKQPKNCEVFEKYIYNYVTSKEHSEEMYYWYIYQTIGLLIQDISNMKNTLKLVKQGKLGWENPIYDSVSSKIQEHDEYIVKPFDVVEGVAQCGKCGSKKTWSIAKQMRSGDEGTSTISRCVECGHHWVYSG